MQFNCFARKHAKREELEVRGNINGPSSGLDRLANESVIDHSKEGLKHHKITEQKGFTYKPVNVDELREAEKEIIRKVQNKAFGHEIALLRHLNVAQTSTDAREIGNRNRKVIKKSNSIYRLDPFLSKDGILRVGGRIRRASLPEDIKHPCILPRKGHVTELIICHHHQKVEHQGRGMTYNSIRSSGFWIIGGGSAVSSHISKCVKWRKFRGAPQEQKMADLPEDRLKTCSAFHL